MDDELARKRLTADIALVAKRDRAAFRRVYEQTSRKLFGVCLRILPDRAAAEDAMQDVYVRLWQHAARFDATRASPITWLCTIARNHAIDIRRAVARQTDHTGAILPLLIPDSPPSADATMIRAETEHEVFVCLESLGEDQRMSIRQAFLEGLTYQELADRRAVPLGTMKSWIRRGLLEMRKCLADD